MANILENLTISGFKAFISDCQGNESVNTAIATPSVNNPGIYSYVETANLVAGSANQKTIYLENAGTGGKGGVRTVDTLAVMARLPNNSTNVVKIGGYKAVFGLQNMFVDLLGLGYIIV
jgi:hypothetical protein